MPDANFSASPDRGLSPLKSLSQLGRNGGLSVHHTEKVLTTFLSPHSPHPSIRDLPSTLSRPSACLSLSACLPRPARPQHPTPHPQRLQLTCLPNLPKPKGLVSLDKTRQRDDAMYDMRREKPEYRPSYQAVEPRTIGGVKFKVTSMQQVRRLD